MTDVVLPSRDRVALANAAAASSFEGSFQRIVPDTERALELPTTGLTSGALGAFDLVSVDSTGDPAEVTIDTGEAFIAGSYLARDTQTQASTSAASYPVTFAVGWEHDAADGVVVQGVDDFRDRDRYLELFKIDSSGNSTDLRQFGLASPDATARPEGSIALGDGATVERNAARSMALGENATIESGATDSVLIGSNATVAGSGVVAFGDGIDVQVSDVFATTIRVSFNDAPVVILPGRGTDPPAPADGSIWYRTDLDEYRGVENGNKVSFDTTQV